MSPAARPFMLVVFDIDMVFPGELPVPVAESYPGRWTAFFDPADYGLCADLPLVGDGPGPVEPIVEELEPVPGCDALIAIPSTAVGAKMTSETAVYWAPGQVSDEVFPAGLSVRAIGVDESGMYTKVLFACGFYWVPTGVIGPNPDSPWNGAPLPTGVVQ